MSAIDPDESVRPRPDADAETPAPVPTSRFGTLKNYVALTKPRIIELLLVTTVPAMLLAADGWPPLGVALGTLLGGGLAAAGANTFNSFLDRDIDALMHRTGKRPLVAGTVSPRNALILAWCCLF